MGQDDPSTLQRIARGHAFRGQVNPSGNFALK
jgi:hypothetical protein